jgi:hypothetical protein
MICRQLFETANSYKSTDRPSNSPRSDRLMLFGFAFACPKRRISVSMKYPQFCVVASCHRLSILVVTGGPCLGFTQRRSPGCCPASPSRVHPRQLHYKARANNTITLVQTNSIRVVVVCSILKLQKDQMGYRCSSDLSQA